ncbi:MAG: EamA family transporter [Lachnospiraceae bacterium]|nr:EamA family transporter [Lachnospiraceae bacterium]
MRQNARGVLCTLLGGSCWGFSAACGQYLFMNYQLDASWITVMRMLGAGITLLIVTFFSQRENFTGIWREPRDRIQLVFFGICGLMFSQFTFLTAISHSNAGTATVLQYLGPVLVMILVCFGGRRLPRGKEVVSIFLAVLGTFLLATHGNPATMVLTQKGLFWGLLSAVSLAMYTLLPARLLPRWGSMVVTGFGMLIGGILLACVVQVWSIPVALDVKGWLAVGGMVVVGTILAYTLYLQGVGDIGSVRASMLASIEPVSATVLSVVWLHTSFLLMDLLGFVCILATVFLLAKKKEE